MGQPHTETENVRVPLVCRTMIPNHMAMLIRTASHTEKILMEMQIGRQIQYTTTGQAHQPRLGRIECTNADKRRERL